MNSGVLTALRDFVPIRPLTRTEAYRIAELQASRFLNLVSVNEAPISERIITELPRLQVQRFSPLPVSGATQWANGKRMILLGERFGVGVGKPACTTPPVRRYPRSPGPNRWKPRRTPDPPVWASRRGVVGARGNRCGATSADFSSPSLNTVMILACEIPYQSHSSAGEPTSPVMPLNSLGHRILLRL